MRPAQKRNNRSKNHHTTSFRRERFLQANHNFAIYPSYFTDERRGYYDGSIDSTDIIIDWDYVSQVWYSTNKQYDCPVCLYPPVCPRIIPCGHVICWPCIYRYFSTRKNKNLVVITKQNAPCPVCQIQVELKDFRSVTLIHQAKYTISQIAKFVLLKRQKTSAIIELSKDEEINLSDLQNIYRIPSTTGKNAPYNRVTLALDLSILQREESELEQGIKEALSSGDETQSLIDAKELWEQYQEIALQRIYIPPSILPNNNNPPQTKPVEYYQFYVLENGRHIYLHQISFRWLMKQFGDAAYFPQVIEGPIIDIEDEICQDEMSRKRFKFLSHLPLGCNFQFAIINLSSVINEENNQGYLAEIHQRNQTKNNEKIEKDKYEERQILRSMKNKERRSYNDAEVTYAMLEGLPLPASQASLFERWNNMGHISNDAANFPSLPTTEPENTTAPSEKTEPPIQSVPGWSGKSLIEMEKEERRKNTKEYQFPELPSYDKTPIKVKPPINSPWVTLGSPKNLGNPSRNNPPVVSRSPNQSHSNTIIANTSSPRKTTPSPSSSNLPIPNTTTTSHTRNTPPPGTGRGLAHSPNSTTTSSSPSTGRGTSKIAK